MPLTKLKLEPDEEVEIPVERSNELMFRLFIARGPDSDDYYSVRLQCKDSVNGG